MGLNSKKKTPPYDNNEQHYSLGKKVDSIEYVFASIEISKLRLDSMRIFFEDNMFQNQFQSIHWAALYSHC